MNRRVHQGGADEGQVAALMRAAVERYGALDILVANAGATATPRATAELPSAEWDAIILTNCTGVFYSVKHAIPHLPDFNCQVLQRCPP